MFSHRADVGHWLIVQQRAIERGEWRSPEEGEAQRPKLRTLQGTYDRFLRQRTQPLALLRLLLAKAMRWGWIDKNPASGGSIPRWPRPMAQRHVFDLDGVRRYLEAAKPRYVAMLAVVASG